MKDVQSGPADVALPIDRVGVSNISLPVRVRTRDGGDIRHTVAEVDLYVDLPAHFKGTHMSRFIEALGRLDRGPGLPQLQDPAAKRVRPAPGPSRAHRLPVSYFLTKAAPASGSPATMDYRVGLSGTLEEGRLTWGLGVEVPVMTVCPCSLAICENAAHSQRAIVSIETRHTGFLWIEDLIAIAEAAGSSPVYALLKREDEKAVTDAAFANPAFVEDVVRAAARALADHPQVDWYRVSVESQESIHNHNAFASIESGGGI